MGYSDLLQHTVHLPITAAVYFLQVSFFLIKYVTELPNIIKENDLSVPFKYLFKEIKNTFVWLYLIVKYNDYYFRKLQRKVLIFLNLHI